MRTGKRIPLARLASLLKVKHAVLLLAFAPLMASSQRQRIVDNGFWICHFGNVHLNKRFSIVTEIEMHTKQWAERWNEQVFDAGLSYTATDRWRFAAGAGWYRGAQYFDAFFFRNEWRGWQEANYTLRGKFVFWQRLRSEERWIQLVSNGRKLDSYDYITRLRYRTELQRPLNGGKVALVLANEFMANPAYWNSNRFLDQNRTWIGANIKLSRTIAVQTQYMKILQWRPNNTLEDQNIFRVNVVQHFNLKG